MNKLDTLFEQELRQRVAAERDETRENLGDGCAQTFDAYREKVGYLRALSDVEHWCAEIAVRLNER